MGFFAISRQIGDRPVSTSECNAGARKEPACFLNISIQESAIHLQASAGWMPIQMDGWSVGRVSINCMKVTAADVRPLASGELNSRSRLCGLRTGESQQSLRIAPTLVISSLTVRPRRSPPAASDSPNEGSDLQHQDWRSRDGSGPPRPHHHFRLRRVAESRQPGVCPQASPTPWAK
jgi:hypothetical protein